MATVAKTLGFVWRCPSARGRLVIGCLAGGAEGLTLAAFSYLLATSLSVLAHAGNLDRVANARISGGFVALGVFAFVTEALKTWGLESAAEQAHVRLRVEWLQAWLRQDAAYLDVHDMAGVATTITTQADRYRQAVGKRLGTGLQLLVATLSTMAFAIYSNWPTALVVLAAAPLAWAASYYATVVGRKVAVIRGSAYSEAGSIAYATVSAIRTVLSLNALPQLILDYQAATQKAFERCTAFLVETGLSNGLSFASPLVLNAILTLFGTYLVYTEIAATGCDPSGSVGAPCVNTGPAIMGAFLAMFFSATSAARLGWAWESFDGARVVVAQVLEVQNRVAGAKEERFYHDEGSGHGYPLDGVEESAPRKLKAILPRFDIDSATPGGLRPSKIAGQVSFKNVHFAYATRPGNPVLKGMDLQIEAGQSVGFCGPSGQGKSTIVSLIERFYDPMQGSIELDGINLKDINVSYLRSRIGLVGQEPTLFATTIADNIRFGNLSADDEQIVAAAKMANAHGFILSFPDAYETYVGDKGIQLSGGQKQRIALARVLVANPSLLLLDEATSALDNESERIVQAALDKAINELKPTTVMIAHRLSTIRNCDVIVFIDDGRVVEKGTHEELMAKPNGSYRNLVEKQQRPVNGGSLVSTAAGSKRESKESGSTTVHLSFRDVDFAYPTRPERTILRSFSLNIHQGETLALCGPSGQGKSTLVALIERFYDPINGSVAYFGCNVRELNLQWYRDAVGYVGQEPTLFGDTIANNIAFGLPGASREQIVEAARQAHALDFIDAFPDGFDTLIGEGGTGLSGGQKQRIAIARALIKKPKLLLLDEATSALDTESERIVQETLTELMTLSEVTTIVIAHRLGTIRDADRIAYIANGRVEEIGSHDDLMAKPNGQYRRLVEGHKDEATLNDAKGKRRRSSMSYFEMEDLDADWKPIMVEDETGAFSARRARQMASPDAGYLSAGALGALTVGSVYAVWGLLYALAQELLFTVVPPCYDCQATLDTLSAELRQKSFFLGLYWVLASMAAVVGFILTFWGFGLASERLNKRLRDQAFATLVRQEVGFFDRNSVGALASELQEDAARIQAFSGEPVRTLLIAVSSFASAQLVGLVFMWPFALLGLALVPLLYAGTSIKTGKLDYKPKKSTTPPMSPSGILVETLVNVRTVAALTLEKHRCQSYEQSLEETKATGFVMTGLVSGTGELADYWVRAALYYWAGYLLFTYPDQFTFFDFLVANAMLLLGVMGLGAALVGVSDRSQLEQSARRIFYLLDRQSAIDPLSKAGKKLD